MFASEERPVVLEFSQRLHLNRDVLLFFLIHCDFSYFGGAQWSQESQVGNKGQTEGKTDISKARPVTWRRVAGSGADTDIDDFFKGCAGKIDDIARDALAARCLGGAGTVFDDGHLLWSRRDHVALHRRQFRKTRRRDAARLGRRLLLHRQEQLLRTNGQTKFGGR